tara:strand:- start:1042 stop:1182 length:141 start_codon:yes stop_codon:yes gene_type:complete
VKIKKRRELLERKKIIATDRPSKLKDIKIEQALAGLAPKRINQIVL